MIIGLLLRALSPRAAAAVLLLLAGGCCALGALSWIWGA